MKLSIIIPVYNNADSLVRMLESFIHQVKENCEIILVDDDSSDGSKSLISNYIKLYPVIIAYGKKHRGRGSALNVGLEKARGEYVVFLNPENYVSSEFISVILNRLKDSSVDLLKYQRQYVYRDRVRYVDDHVEFKHDGGEAFINLKALGISFELLGLYVYRRAYLKSLQVPFLDDTHCENFGIVGYYLVQAKQVDSLREGLYFYVVDKKSKKEDYARKKRELQDMIAHFDYLYPIASKNIENHLALEAYLSYLTGGILKNLSFLKKNDKKEIIEELKKRKILKIFRKNSSFKEYRKMVLHIYFDIYLKLVR